MKKLLPLALLAILFTFAGCNKKKEVATMTYRIATPVFESKSVIYDQVGSQPAKQLDTPGKIFVIGKYLFISEAGKGVHVYDNAIPSDPKAISFINIPGNEDVAVKGNYLYADLYSDLVTIDITDPLNAKLTDKTPNIFSHKYDTYYWGMDEEKFIVEYIEKDTTVVVKDYGPDIFWENCANCFQAVNSDVGQPKAHYSPGVAGSMARMVIARNHIYAVTSWSLIAVDLADPSAPERKSETQLSWGIETVYPFQNKLFIGSTSGMFIYNIDDPAAPVAEGSFTHARACDPVVTDGDYAYVTLRTGGDQCAGNANQLDILNVSDVSQPLLVKTYPLFNPHGLGKDGDLLFICDGTDGIKIFDASEVHDLKLVGQVKGVDAYDVIPWGGVLIASTKGGLKQYDYSDLGDIRLLSTIK